jgi:hypothetical protein
VGTVRLAARKFLIRDFEPPDLDYRRRASCFRFGPRIARRLQAPGNWLGATGKKRRFKDKLVSVRGWFALKTGLVAPKFDILLTPRMRIHGSIIEFVQVSDQAKSSMEHSSAFGSRRV